MYSLNSKKKFKNGTNKRKVNIKKINDSILIADTLKLGGEYGLGIQMYDQQDSGYNKNGVYKTEVILNNHKVFDMTFNEFSFKDKQYINYLIDYKSFFEKKIKINKLFIDKIPKISFLDFKLKNGKLSFTKELKYDITINLIDYKKNTKTIKFHVIGSNNNLKDVDSLHGQKIEFDSSKTFQFENKALIFSKNSYHENVKVKIKNTRDTLIVENKNFPLNKPVKIKFKYLETDSLNSHSGIGLIYQKQKIRFLPSKIVDGEIVSSSFLLGKFLITKDSIPPTIKPLNFFTGKWMSKNTFIKFTIEDDFSGIKKYEGKINNKWILLEYEPKNKTLIYNFNDIKFNETRLNIELNVIDNANNISTYKSYIFRKL